MSNCGRIRDWTETDEVVSKVTGEKWIWVKVPKTATVAYRAIFFPEIAPHALQTHKTYHSLSFPDDGRQAFTVVRNPLNRFRSAVAHLLGKSNHFAITFSSTTHLVDFFTPLVPYLKEHRWYATEWTEQHFLCRGSSCPECKLYYPGFIHSIFASQVHWAYHPSVRVFRHERIEEFNTFIETELGYDTTCVARANVSRAEGVAHIDFTAPAVIDLVHQLYDVDYMAFGYE
jgi:hypothetical protein